LGAAARIAVEKGRHRLTEDHENARTLAEGLLDLHEDAVDLASVETNMVYLNLEPFNLGAPEVAQALKQEGVLTLGMPGYSMRLVTHRDISAEQTKQALEALRKVVG
ncbi:MAG: threonine aldolase, partial [Actinomycetota bacterium]|nr:threonine aldolase [Actinomycetota bacterium]